MLSQIIAFIQKLFAMLNQFLEKLGIKANWDNIFGELTADASQE